MPVELQEEVMAIVEQTRTRSGWPVRRTLARLGIPPGTYYRWPPVQPYEALPEEREAVKQYALKHPKVRHRELAWRMVDEDVAYLSPSTVCRILREEKLVCPWRRRTKRRREEEKAQRPDAIWATDLKYVSVGARNYYLICFLDEYSRYIVHHELLPRMDGHSVSLAAQAALEKLPRDEHGELIERPEIRSDVRQRLRLARVRRGTGSLRSEPSADQAALSGGERADGAGLSGPLARPWRTRSWRTTTRRSR